MLPSEIADRILTIGPVASPLGGISQVMINYRDFIFPHMRHLAFNTGDSGWPNVWAFFRVVFSEIYQLIRYRKISIVHFHTAAGITFLRVFVFWLIAKLLLRKTIMHIHAGAFKDYYHAHTRFVGFVLRHCDEVITLSEEWKEFFTNEVGLNNVSIINNVMAIPEYKSVDKDAKIHLLFLGHMIANKGIYDLLDVMTEHQDDYRGRLVLHIGGSRNEEEIQNIIRSNHLSDFVFFEGWVTGNRKNELLNLCDIFVLPSYIEGLPISILECMSYRMAIISTTIGGIPSIVKNDINGYLFAPGDKKALANCIDHYLASPSLIVSHGAQSLENAKPFMPSAVSDELKALYSELLYV